MNNDYRIGNVQKVTLNRDQLSSADNELNKTLIDSIKNLTSIVIKSTPAELADSVASVESLLNNY